MFNCNNYNLLTFTYYLKYFLAFNMTIIPFIYLYINIIQAIKQKRKNVKITKYFFIDRFKSCLYIIIIFLLSFTIHNMLNTNNNVCYLYANTNIYYKYKNKYTKLNNTKINEKIKVEYLENVLTNTSDEDINNLENLTNEKVDNFLHETDNNQLNRIFVVDGVFYYPKYTYGNKDTYSGIYCPSNPEKEGYNNPYGYNNYFYTRLTKFIDEASKNGYKITISDQGCRNYNTQINYYNSMDSGRAASPGYSLHGFGIASDLEFYQNDGSICSGYRTDYNCPSMGWAHNHANEFGLTFPLLNSSYKEDWHIEPINKQSY